MPWYLQRNIHAAQLEYSWFSQMYYEEVTAALKLETTGEI
jgi:hypothetical protein